MKTHGLLFKPEMVRAILNGSKSQTRRLIKRQPGFEVFKVDPPGKDVFDKKWTKSDYWQFSDCAPQCPLVANIKCPYKPGDLIYVKETYRQYWKTDDYGELDTSIPMTTDYRADGGHEMLLMQDGDGFIETNKDGSEKYIPWKPSIFMPKSAARIWLRIDSVRAERWQDITKDDAIAEGILRDEMGYKDYDKKRAEGYGHPDYDYPHLISPIASFKSLIISIHGPDSWDKWCWRIAFRVTSKSGIPETK